MTSIVRTPRILVFDSGVGGLSVLHEIQRRLPVCEFIYASDNEAFPYGIKSEDELITRVDKVLRQILASHPVDIIVIACNTASTVALPHIRNHFTQPIVGVVPAIKPAAIRSRSKVIGLLATPGTVSRPYTHDLIRQHAAECVVIKVGTSELVQMAEQKLRGEQFSMARLTKILAPFRDHADARQLDTLVLACTHFPLLLDELKQALPDHIDFIDSGEAIARRVEFLLSESLGLQQAELSQPNTSWHRAIFTQDTPAVERLRAPLHTWGIEYLDFVSI
jgi:glutamate racemase